MFSKKKKKPQISMPSNFEHRVHTGFDKREGRYVGLPLQWASIVGNNQILKSTNRPLPLVDPSEITLTEILDLKTIVRPHFHKPNSNMDDTASMKSTLSNSTATAVATNGIVLPKTSHVARSNSLRSSSPPRVQRRSANVPPSVPEEPSQIPMSNMNMQANAAQMQQYHNASANMPPQVNYVTKPPHPMQMNQYNNGMNAAEIKGFNGNGMAQNPISVHTDFSPAAPYRYDTSLAFHTSSYICISSFN